MPELIRYEVTGSVARVTMDDGKVNALTLDLLGALADAFDRAEADGVAVVLAGREGRFSAGFDLNVLRSGGADARRLLRAGFETSYRMLSFPLPVVVACTGHALAMASFLLLSGDHRIGVAGADHKIRANEVAIGLTMPRAAIEICRQRLSQRHFDRVVILAELYHPDSAVDAGFLDEVTSANDLLDAAQRKADDLMTLSLAALAGTKARTRAASLAALREAIEADDADFAGLSAR